MYLVSRKINSWLKPRAKIHAAVKMVAENDERESGLCMRSRIWLISGPVLYCGPLSSSGHDYCEKVDVVRLSMP